MDAALILRTARLNAGLSQGELADRSATSQATISAYERGRKQPSVATLTRLLAAAGTRLSVEALERPVVQPSPDRLALAGRTLAEVIELAATLPTRHEPQLRYPRLDRAGSA